MSQEKKEKKTAVGGQAVIEGVMMKGPEYLATAVRRLDGEIVYRRKKIDKKSEKFFKMPFIRGVFILFETLIMGTKELTFSAVQAGQEEEEEELSDFQLGATLMFSFAIGIGLFFLLPSFLAGALFKSNEMYSNIFEGVLRLAMFVAYIYLISLSNDIKRVFQYHGAEHKAIYAFENKDDLTVENVKKYTTLHPRCGTSFLIVVMLISIVVFSFVDLLFIKTDSMLLRSVIKFGLRIGFLPLIGGISYEILKYSSNNLNNIFIKMISAPGLWLQNLTTREPDEDQIEVGIVALKASLGEEIENAVEIKEDKECLQS